MTTLLTTQEDVNHASQKAEVRYEWTVRPWVAQPNKLVVLIVFALLASAAGIILFRQVAMGFVGFGIVMGANADYWMTSHFTLTEEKAVSRRGASVTELAWEDVKRILVSDRMVQLSPLDQESRLEAFRGVFLTFDPSQREQVLAWVNELRGDNGSIC